MDIDYIYEEDDWDKKMNEKRLAKRIGQIVPAVRFKIRVRDDSIQGPNPFRWDEMNTYQMFAGKKVIVFSLPGAFTPTCDTYQLPGFEKKHAVEVARKMLAEVFGRPEFDERKVAKIGLLHDIGKILGKPSEIGRAHV